MLRRRFVESLSITAAAAAALPRVVSAAGPSAHIVGEEGLSAVGLDRLLDLFTRHLKICEVKKGETVLFYFTTTYGRKEYIPAILKAATDLGAHAMALEAMPGGDRTALLVESFKAADIVYGQIPLYSDAHNIALASGTRTVLLTVEPETLERFFPDPATMKRGYAGAERLTRAKTMRVTDASGSDFTLYKEGRKGSAMVGVSAEPGTWDQFPHGSVACAPLEGRGDGIYMINPGDTISRLTGHVKEAVKMTLRAGRIINVEGGQEAAHIRSMIEAGESYRDPEGRMTDPRGIGHAGWGIDKRSNWDLAPRGRDSQMWYGSVMVSIGVNFFDAPARYSGLGGKNYTSVHIDICCRHKDVYLDGKLVLNRDEKFLDPALV